MMRYDHAFFARQNDVSKIITLGNNVIFERFSILLAKYDFRGPTKANWTEARLLSDQEYERIESTEKLYALGADFYQLRPNGLLKVCTEIEITAPVNDVVLAMYQNQGLPADEGSAHIIEQEFYVPAADRKPITVKLKRYTVKEEFWTL